MSANNKYINKISMYNYNTLLTYILYIIRSLYYYYNYYYYYYFIIDLYILIFYYTIMWFIYTLLYIYNKLFNIIDTLFTLLVLYVARLALGVAQRAALGVSEGVAGRKSYQPLSHPGAFYVKIVYWTPKDCKKDAKICRKTGTTSS